MSIVENAKKDIRIRELEQKVEKNMELEAKLKAAMALPQADRRFLSG